MDFNWAVSGLFHVIPGLFHVIPGLCLSDLGTSLDRLLVHGWLGTLLHRPLRTALERESGDAGDAFDELLHQLGI